MKLFLGNFLNDWWNALRIFFTEMDRTVYGLILAALGLCALLCMIRILKPAYSVDKNKFRIAPIIFFVIFAGLIALIAVLGAR